MNFIKELYYSVKSGVNEGKGHKFTRKGDYQTALSHYSKALAYSIDDYRKGCMLECKARTYARLGEYDKSLNDAFESLKLFSAYEGEDPVFDNALARLRALIESIQKHDEKKLRSLLSI